MKQRNIFTLALTNLLVLVFTLNPLSGPALQAFTGANNLSPTPTPIKVSGTSRLIQDIALKMFTGSGDMTTDSFECAGVCRITWTTEAPDPTEARIRVEIYQPTGRPYNGFSGQSGTTYLYAEGSFYFEVEAHSENTTWEITMEDVPLPEPRMVFSGEGGDYFTTEIFTCAEHCSISWTTTAVDPPQWAGLLFYIYQVGEKDFEERRGGSLSGTTHFYAEGTFYFHVRSGNLGDITTWEITVKETPLPPPRMAFSGEDGASDTGFALNTGIFLCKEHCRITWTTETEEPTRARFEVKIHHVRPEKFNWGPFGRSGYWYEEFGGRNGTTHYYITSLSYFELDAYRITAWVIRVEEVPLPPPSTVFKGVVEGEDSGAVTTGIFTCTEHCRITWTTKGTEPTQRAYFLVFIRQVGKKDYSDLYYKMFNGRSGTTHLYAKGTFYFAVVDIHDISTWEITVEDIPITEPSTAFMGDGDSITTTETFTCGEHCVLTWRINGVDLTEDSFLIVIHQVGDPGFEKQLGGSLRGTFDLYDEGTFYFIVYTLSKVTAWVITVEDVSPLPISRTSTSSTTSTTPITPEIQGISLLWLLSAMLVAMVAAWKKRRTQCCIG